VSHRGTFVDKETDEAFRRGERQRVTEQVHRLAFFTMEGESFRFRQSFQKQDPAS
jgi:hypothetical protein